MTILALIKWQGGKAFPKISEAMDGRSEAHMDVLVAFFGKAFPPCRLANPIRLGPETSQTTKCRKKIRQEKTR
jgi:hypothetical protein